MPTNAGLVFNPSVEELQRFSRPINGSSPDGLHFYPRFLIILTVSSYALLTWLFPRDIVACVSAHFLVKRLDMSDEKLSQLSEVSVSSIP